MEFVSQCNFLKASCFRTMNSRSELLIDLPKDAGRGQRFLGLGRIHARCAACVVREKGKLRPRIDAK